MGEKRMFAKTIVMSDAFLDMPMSARCLYFTLGMFGDDDGFVNAPKAIMRQIGATVDDLKILIAKKFVLMFDSGVIVIKHWRINNYLRNDRYNETKYQEEKAQLIVGEDNIYHMAGIPTVDQRYTNGIPNITEHNITKHNITQTEQMFEEFWSLYPKKADKKKALDAFKDLDPSDELFEEIKNAVIDQKESDQWIRGYVPNPTTWLKNERWKDVLEKPKPRKGLDYIQRKPEKNSRFGMDYIDKAEVTS